MESDKLQRFKGQNVDKKSAAWHIWGLQNILFSYFRDILQEEH
jgi:hypothetical protein